jgi:heat shock protein HtpX
MKKLKGIGLLLLSNILIIATLSITFTILSQVILPAFGIDIRGIVSGPNLLFAAFFGFGGAFLSLAMSKFLAKMMVGAARITHPETQAEQLVFDTVQKISERLKITMPEVYIYESPDPNAFATGPSRNNSMVAVSTGLMQNLNQNEIRAVLAHEMGHVYNGDMFTTTVLAGLMNTFVYLIANFIYRLLAERSEGLAFMAYFVIQTALSILAMIPISWWSRRREFSADRFAANTVGKEHMISALQAIHRWVNQVQYQYHNEDALATMKISGQTRSFMQIFSTHPPIEARVAALQDL